MSDELHHINAAAREAQDNLAKLDAQRQWVIVDLPFAFKRVTDECGRLVHAVQQLGLKADEPTIVDNQ